MQAKDHSRPHPHRRAERRHYSWRPDVSAVISSASSSSSICRASRA